MNKHPAMRSLLLIICMSLLLACGSETSSQSGSLTLGLTDAATPEYEAVYITIREVQANKADISTEANGEEADGGWTVVGQPNKTYNLLELVNGLIEPLGETTLTAGRYHQLRLILGNNPDGSTNILGTPHPYANYIIINTDEVHELKVPSGHQTGLKVIHDFTIYSRQNTELVLDFNVAKSIVQAGASGKWILKPTIRVIDNYATAYVNGIVFDADTQEPIAGALISAQKPTGELSPDIVLAATLTNDMGVYALFLEPGAYTIVAAKERYTPEFATGNVLEVDEILQQDFSLAPVLESGTISGTVHISGGAVDQSITISIRQTLQDGTIAEVAAACVADEASYEFELPVGLYSLLAVLKQGDQITTQEEKEAFSILDGTDIVHDIVF